THRRLRQQAQRNVVKRGDGAAFQLELDLADPFARLPAGGLDRTAVDRGLDARAWGRREVSDEPGDVGAEDRGAAFGEVRGEETSAFAGKRVGAFAGDRVFPLAAGEGGAARHACGRYGLNVMPVTR